MKELFAGIVLILVLGFGAFLYRNIMQRPAAPAASVVVGTACTADAKVCPDGTAVSRTGTACRFAACPAPNAEFVTGSTTLDFLPPAGYAGATGALPAAASLLASYAKPATNGSHLLAVSAYAIPAGESATQAMLANTTMDPSGLPAKASDLHAVTIGGRSYQMVTTERFEGQVRSVYYLPEGNTLFAFSILERDVNNWTDAALDVRALPEHAALEGMLARLQVSSS